jgi:hypothetical protein
LWECFHASAVEAESQSQVADEIWGSFIQSHWPCMTLWPISMFSRTLAIESSAVPASQAGRRREASSSTPPEDHEPAVNLDHAHDVAPVPVSQLGEDLAVDGVELAAERLDLLVAEPRERALDHAGHPAPLMVGVTGRSRWGLRGR